MQRQDSRSLSRVLLTKQAAQTRFRRRVFRVLDSPHASWRSEGNSMIGKAMNWSRLAGRHRMWRQSVEDGKGTGAAGAR
jgi:hypothetical protein